MEILEGKVTGTRDGNLLITVPYPDYGKAVLRQFDAVQVGLPDGRTISPDQRKKVHAILNEIAEWNGSFPEVIKRQLKMDFIIERMQSLEKKMFSLSDCDMTTAREFISYLIDFMIEFGVPSKVPLYERAEDIERYVYACLMNKRCAVCGREHADLHHHDRLKSGADRTTTPQLGMAVISLCRKHHMDVDVKPRNWLTDELHLTPIPLTDEIAKVYGLTKKARRNKK